jgi:hypothetical protein
MPKEMSLKLVLFLFVMGLYSFFVMKTAKPSVESPKTAIATEAQTSQSSMAPDSATGEKDLSN